MPNFSKSGVNVIRVKSLSLPLASTIFGLFTLLMLFSNTCLYLRPLALGSMGWSDSKSAPRAARCELSSPGTAIPRAHSGTQDQHKPHWQLLRRLFSHVAGFHDKLGAEDVAQLGAISVTTTSDLLLSVVVVGRGQKVACKGPPHGRNGADEPCGKVGDQTRPFEFCGQAWPTHKLPRIAWAKFDQQKSLLPQTAPSWKYKFFAKWIFPLAWARIRTEDKLWHIHALFLMHLDGDTLAGVVDTDGVGLPAGR